MTLYIIIGMLVVLLGCTVTYVWQQNKEMEAAFKAFEDQWKDDGK